MALQKIEDVLDAGQAAVLAKLVAEAERVKQLVLEAEFAPDLRVARRLCTVVFRSADSLTFTPLKCFQSTSGTLSHTLRLGSLTGIRWAEIKPRSSFCP